MSRSSDPDSALQALIREAPHGAAAGPDCPSPDLLAALLDGVLVAQEREGLERHLVRCGACRSVIAALADSGMEAAGGEGVGTSAARHPTLAAAALLAVVSLGAVLGWLIAAGEGSTDGWLVAAAERLAGARPDLFADFAPLDPDERRARPPVERGSAGPVLLRPAGRVLEARPELAWEGVPGAGTYSVELSRADGTPVWLVRTPEEGTDFPATEGDLEPGGKYLWTVSVSGVLGEASASRLFSVATTAEAERFEVGLAEIRARVEPSLAELLAAHFALRNEHYAEAQRAAQAAWRADPGDPVRAETLAHVLALLGSREAELPGEL